MIDRMNSIGPVGRGAYVRQTKQAEWREEILTQALAKVREMSPAVRQVPSRPPVKGGLLDVFA